MLLPLLLIIICHRPVIAQESSYQELQAAYLYNFAKYIQWPEEKDTFKIGVISANREPLHTLTQVLAGKKIGGQELIISNVSSSDSLSSYQILYLPKEASGQLENIARLVRNQNVLIVTEEDMAGDGATISFLMKDNRLRFKLHKQSLENEGLVASSGLLQLAILL